MLKKIISAGQTGADVAGLIVAKQFGLETGGWMPKGFLTQSGPRPEWAEQYGLTEHNSAKYPPRTYSNVKDSDATIRIAHNMHSPGEICTLNAIRQYKKPHIDVEFGNYPIHDAPSVSAETVVEFLEKHDVKVLNVAGNSEKTHTGMAGDVVEFLSKVFELMGFSAEKNDLQSE